MALSYLCLDKVFICWNAGRLYFSFFESPQTLQRERRLQVSMERRGRRRQRGLLSSRGPPTASGVSTENLLMREWLSPALHFPLCVSEKHKWRSPYRQVCLPVKSPTAKICWTTQWKPLILCLRWHGGKIINVLWFYGAHIMGSCTEWKSFQEKTRLMTLSHVPLGRVNGLVVGAAVGHRFDFNCDTNTALTFFFFLILTS